MSPCSDLGRDRPRTALHTLALSLARNRDVIAFARALVRRPRPGHRVSRLAAVFSFVGHLVDVPAAADGEIRDGVDLLLGLAGDEEGPSLILAALLLALGEKAWLGHLSGVAFVRVELEPTDLSRLPPHAQLLASGGRCYLALDPRRARSPLGFLPRSALDALKGASRVPARRPISPRV